MVWTLYTKIKNSQDESDENLYFMLRVKLEKGAMNLEQMKVVSEISEKYAKETATLTTRQDIQFHNISVQNLPTIFEKTSKGRLKHCIRSRRCTKKCSNLSSFWN